MLGRISVGRDLQRELLEERLEGEISNIGVAGNKSGKIN